MGHKSAADAAITHGGRMAKPCGAKTRSRVGTCRNPAKPNGKCRFHGGLSTGPKKYNAGKNNLKHGIYAAHMAEAEMDSGVVSQLGSVVAELHVCRIRLARALAAENAAKAKPELAEIIKRDIAINIGARTEKKWQTRDYGAAIDRILARIESLERTRLLMRVELGLTDEEMNADALTPGEPDETPPAKPIR